jgi:hypothetical protein
MPALRWWWSIRPNSSSGPHVAVHIGLPGHVGDGPAGLLADGLRDGLGRVAVEVDDEHPRTLGCEPPRGGRPESGAGPGHDRHLPREPGHPASTVEGMSSDNPTVVGISAVAVADHNGPAPRFGPGDRDPSPARL